MAFIKSKNKVIDYLHIENRCLYKMGINGWTPIKRNYKSITSIKNVQNLDDFFKSKLTPKSDNINYVFNVLKANILSNFYKSQVSKIQDVINTNSNNCSLTFMCLILISKNLQDQDPDNQIGAHQSPGNFVKSFKSKNKKRINHLRNIQINKQISLNQFYKKFLFRLISSQDSNFYQAIFRRNNKQMTKSKEKYFRRMPPCRDSLAHGNIIKKSRLSYLNFLKLLLFCKNESIDLSYHS